MIHSAIRSGRVEAAARQGLLAALKSQHGVVDLPSIMVGVLVAAILAGGATAGVATMIPMFQDNAAKSAIATVRTAEEGTSVRDGQYKAMDTLIVEGRIQKYSTLEAGAGESGSCYVIASLSDSGTVFYATSRDDTIVSDSSGPVDTSWCVTLPAFQSKATG